MAKQVTKACGKLALVAAIDFIVEAKTDGRRVSREEIGDAIGSRIRIDIPNESDDYVYKTPSEWGQWLSGQFAKADDGKPTPIPAKDMKRLQQLYSLVCFRGRKGGNELGESDQEEVSDALNDAFSKLGLAD